MQSARSRRAEFLIVLSLALSLQPGFAGTTTVTNTDDAGAGSLRAAIESINGAGEASNTIVFSLGAGGTITLTSDLPRLTQSTAITTAAGATITNSAAAIAYGLDIETGKTLTLPGGLSIIAATSNTTGAIADRAVGIGNSQIDDYARAGDLTLAAPIAGTVSFADRFTGALSVTSARTGSQGLLGQNPTTLIGVAEPRFATGIEAASVTFQKGFGGTLTVNAASSTAGIEAISNHVFDIYDDGTRFVNRERIDFGDITFGAPDGAGSSFDGTLTVTGGGGSAPTFELCDGFSNCYDQPVLNAGDVYGLHGANITFASGMTGTIDVNGRTLASGETSLGTATGIASTLYAEQRWWLNGPSLSLQSPSAGGTVTFGSVGGQEGFAGTVDVSGAFDDAFGLVA
jgi:hypothetical protein